LGLSNARTTGRRITWNGNPVGSAAIWGRLSQCKLHEAAVVVANCHGASMKIRISKLLNSSKSSADNWTQCLARRWLTKQRDDENSEGTNAWETVNDATRLSPGKS